MDWLKILVGLSVFDLIFGCDDRSNTFKSNEGKFVLKHALKHRTYKVQYQFDFTDTHLDEFYGKSKYQKMIDRIRAEKQRKINRNIQAHCSRIANLDREKRFLPLIPLAILTIFVTIDTCYIITKLNGNEISRERFTNITTRLAEQDISLENEIQIQTEYGEELSRALLDIDRLFEGRDLLVSTDLVSPIIIDYLKDHNKRVVSTFFEVSNCNGAEITGKLAVEYAHKEDVIALFSYQSIAQFNQNRTKVAIPIIPRFIATVNNQTVSVNLNLCTYKPSRIYECESHALKTLDCKTDQIPINCGYKIEAFVGVFVHVDIIGDCTHIITNQQYAIVYEQHKSPYHVRVPDSMSFWLRVPFGTKIEIGNTSIFGLNNGLFTITPHLDAISFNETNEFIEDEKLLIEDIQAVEETGGIAKAWANLKETLSKWCDDLVEQIIWAIIAVILLILIVWSIISCIRKKCKKIFCCC